MHSTAEDSISSSTIAAGDGREVAAAAAAVATNTTTTASHSYYNLCNFFWSAEEGHKISERSNELEEGVVPTERQSLKTERPPPLVLPRPLLGARPLSGPGIGAMLSKD